MNFQKSRVLHLVGAAMIASAAFAVSPASAQQKADCVVGSGTNCEDTFGASSAAKSAAPAQAAAANASTAKYDAYLAKKETQQAVLSVALTRAAEQGIKGIMKACQAVSPNKPIDACP
jgi:hypothetical protein